MSKKCLALFIFGVLLFCGEQISAQTPKLPYKDVGACPFECCTYRQWTANKATIVYKEMRDNSPIAFKVKSREKVTGITGVVITTKAGLVKALKNYTTPNANIRIKAGDIFYLLTYRGEGFYLIWYKGKEFVDEIYEQGEARVLSQPEAVWWVKIKNRRGQIGWTRLAENFDNKDSCG